MGSPVTFKNLADGQSLDGHLLPGLAPAGVPRGLTKTILPFHYNRLDELEAIVAAHGTELAAIVMEPARSQGPADGFLAAVREIATRIGAVLVFDEITSGWRINTGGIHLTYGVAPDVAAFAKAMSNGYAMAAVLGRREVMEAAQTSFISSTYWTERIGPAAALATIKKHRREKVGEYLVAVGQQIQAGWQQAAQQAGLNLHVSGIAPLSHFKLEYPNADALTTLFIQLMLERGFLASASFYASLAHQPPLVDRYLENVAEVFQLLVQAIEQDKVDQLLLGPIKHTGFQRLN